MTPGFPSLAQCGQGGGEWHLRCRGYVPSSQLFYNYGCWGKAGFGVSS